MKRNFKKGFTLAELLIVIAIIAILIGIMFPVFGAQLDKARAAAELANVRAAYSELVADQMLAGTVDATKGTTDISKATDWTTITIKVDDLKKACTYKEGTNITSVTATNGDPENGTNGSVTVTYKTYTGSFATDPDVVFDVGGTSGGEEEVTPQG